MRRYYSNIVGKFGAPVNAVLKNYLLLKFLVFVHHMDLFGEKYKSSYRKISKMGKYGPTKEGVVIVYGSMYGHTAEMAEYLGRELGNRGIKDVIIL